VLVPPLPPATVLQHPYPGRAAVTGGGGNLHAGDLAAEDVVVDDPPAAAPEMVEEYVEE
jgi:hypothetical protein